MLHLSSERLAELADGEPTVAEAEHLAACAICATERSAHQRLLSLAGDERDRIAPPLTDWSTLSARLRERAASFRTMSPRPISRRHRRRAVRRSRRPHRRAWLAGLRVAAGLVFAVGFGALGRMSAGAVGRARRAGSDRALSDSLAERRARRHPPMLLGRELAVQRPSRTALAALETSQRNYDRAVAFIAAHDSTGSRRKRAKCSARDSRRWTRWPRRRGRRWRSLQRIPCSISTTSRRSARVK